MEIYTVQNAQQKKAHMRNINIYCSKCATIAKPKMRNRKNVYLRNYNLQSSKNAQQKDARLRKDY